ncbi:hypothetical protein NLX71_13650 [Paenibacillus sp. MZ04-78.2]|uniref:hypothetical protein n=1 Tax=Paenibacillus sp. MZ04-78.2 TaxID=2962034 RepID=UPI0020B6B4B7|nr:hypothetical protein [Paenibacillus sp. MZ04-78.2]MCP3774342.1 hypothetical protein [Paenibacillus sp. MZ04-78.2]
MSLEILITTVETETKEPKEVILDCLTRIVEKFGTNPFDDDDILDTISTIGILLCEKLHSKNYLNIVFKYACNINRGEEETNNLSNNCMFCNQTLHEKIDDHEINRVYNFTRKNYEIIISYLASENEKKYFMNELIKNFENLGKEKML